jgi:hypothetical protein
MTSQYILWQRRADRGGRYVLVKELFSHDRHYSPKSQLESMVWKGVQKIFEYS